jgi:hypothetical protein
MSRVSHRALLLVMLLLVVCSTPVVAQPATPPATPLAADLAYPPEASVGGRSLPAWSAAFNQWLSSFPTTAHPLTDPSGERCAYGQSGPVFFLTSSMVTTSLSCTVPAGVPLLLPILHGACSTVEPPPYFGRDEAELRACAEAPLASPTTLAVAVDGQRLPDVAAYRTTSPLHTLVLPADNWLEVPPGVASSVAGGYYPLLKPLPVGTHTITYNASIPAMGSVVQARFELTVAEPAIVVPDATPTG